jgi:hypothetical protein
VFLPPKSSFLGFLCHFGKNREQDKKKERKTKRKGVTKTNLEIFDTVLSHGVGGCAVETGKAKSEMLGE